MNPTREDAWDLLNEYTKNPNLIKHALAVEAAMAAYAERFEGDVERWRVTGLVHDFDYEQHPTADEHPSAGCAILESLGWPAEIIEAVQGHAPYLGVPRTTNMAKALFAVDELTGLIVACTLVRPDKSLHSLKVSSVMKKWKDKAFARGVEREDIELGAEELGVPLREHVSFAIAAMASIAPDLGLDGA